MLIKIILKHRKTAVLSAEQLCRAIYNYYSIKQERELFSDYQQIIIKDKWDPSLHEKSRENGQFIKMNSPEKSGNQESTCVACSSRDEFNKAVVSGGIKLNISIQKQKRHIQGTKEFNQYKNSEDKNHNKRNPSYLTISIAEAQGLVNTYTKTGTLKKMPDGRFLVHFTHTSVIGIAVSPDGKRNAKTCCGTIHYSNTGTHVVPAWERRTKQNEQ